MGKLRLGGPEEAGMWTNRIEYLDQLLSCWVEKGIAPSIVSVVARNGVITLHKAYGIKSPGPDYVPLTTDTLFPVASISKSITAACVMMLVEDGLIDLGDSVSTYIPEFTGKYKEKVNIHHLLTHSSGIIDSDLYACVQSKKEKDNITYPEFDSTQHPKIGEWLHLIYDAPLTMEPGKQMNYCNTGYLLAAEIVRRISGQSLEDFAQHRIFQSLGMKNTFFIVPKEQQFRVVRRGEDLPFAGLNSQDSMEIPWASGGLYSTAGDLAIYAQMFLNKGTYDNARIISPVSVAHMTRNQIPGIAATYGGQVFSNASWGYGWNVREDKLDDAGCLRSPRSFVHGGAGGSFLFIDPEYDVLGVYLSVTTYKPGTEDFYSMKNYFSNTVLSCLQYFA